ncbi:MAG: hypothetical protein M3R61_16385, partial [Chloroflexota bacterium]|nr:hypothetical protein [Chloroflexota bacterium]
MIQMGSGHARVIGMIALFGTLLAACSQAAPATAPTTANAPTAAPAAATAAPALTTAPAPTAAPAAPTAASVALGGELVIYSGRAEPLIKPVIDLFQKQYPSVEVKLKAASNNELAAALLEERANPQADLFITTDMLTVASLGKDGVFEAYQPEGSERIPAEYRDPANT